MLMEEWNIMVINSYIDSISNKFYEIEKKYMVAFFHKNIKEKKKWANESLSIVTNTLSECANQGNIDDYATIFAIYCNYVITTGLHLIKCYEENTLFGVKKQDIADKCGDIFAEYVSEIFNGIYNQEDSRFKKASEICPEYSVAWLYLLVIENSAPNLEDKENEKMIKYFSHLSDEYFAYAIKDTCTESEKYNIYTENYRDFLPYLSFYTTEYIKLQNIKNNFKYLTELLHLKPENFENDYENSLRKLTEFVYQTTNDDILVMNYFSALSDFSKKAKEISNNSDFENIVNEFPEIPPLLQAGAYTKSIICEILLDEVQQETASNTLNTPGMSETEENIRDSEDVEKRRRFLRILNLVPDNFSRNKYIQLRKMNLKLEENNRELRQAQNDRAEIIQDFSHTYKNMRATQLYNVAKALLKMEDKELKKYGRTILLEYGIKQELTKAVEMLLLKFDDKSEELLKRIRKSIPSENSGYNIKNILDESIKRCLITLLHDGSDNGKRFRKAFVQSEKDFDLISLRNDFENDILFQENKNVISWFSENIFPVETEFSEEWLNLSFEKENYAAIILIDILSELTANIFKYSDKTKPCRFIFNSNAKMLCITAENSVDPIMSNLHGTQKGLFSMEKTIDMLNHAIGLRDKFVKISKKNENFSVIVSLGREIF